MPITSICVIGYPLGDSITFRLFEVLWGVTSIQLLAILSTSFLSAQAPRRIWSCKPRFFAQNDRRVLPHNCSKTLLFKAQNPLESGLLPIFVFLTIISIIVDDNEMN